MKDYLAIKREWLAYAATWINLQRVAEGGAGWGWWGKPIGKPYVRHDNIYRLFFSWKNYKNGEQINGCWRLRGCEERRSVAVKERLEGLLWRWRCSVSWLYPCQYLAVKTCFSFKRCFPWGKLWERHTGSYNCYNLQSYNLQLLFLTTTCESTMISKLKA